MGHLAVQIAKVLDLKVIGVDARDPGLELSKKAGADLVLDARKPKKEIVKQAMDFTGGDGCDATVNFSDHETAAELACAITKMHARMVQVAQVRQLANCKASS